MKIIWCIFLLSWIAPATKGQNVGVAVASPKAAFNVGLNKTVLFGDDSTSADNKLIYYGTKGALRSGFIIPDIGFEIGDYSTAFGIGNHASGISSSAWGSNNQSTGNVSCSIGTGNAASGPSSTAIGYNNIASRVNSFAIGTENVSNGFESFSIGHQLVSSGTRSFAIGAKMNSNGHEGVFMVGDNDPTGQGTTPAGTSNQFIARFANGYYLLSSGNNIRTGVQLPAGGNAWLSISNKNLKENFDTLDDESILKKLAGLTFSSWNYKGQDPATFRHYGVMAQDFFKAFGRDKFGVIGCDTLVNPVDMMGIAYSAIKALEARTSQLEELSRQVIELRKVVASLQKKERIIQRKSLIE